MARAIQPALGRGLGWALGAFTREGDVRVSRGGSTISDGGADAVGDVDSGGTAYVYTIHNDGADALTVASVATGSLSNVTSATVSGITTPVVVAPGGSTTFTVTVTPTTSGALSYTLTVTSDDPDAEAVYTVSVSGTGVSGWTKPTKAALLDGADEYIDFGDQCDGDYNVPMTWSFWFKPTNLTGNRWLMTKGSSSGGPWNFQRSSAGAVTLFLNSVISGRLQVASAAGMMSAGAWAHVVVTYSAATGYCADITMYAAGASVSKGTPAFDTQLTTAMGTADPVRIGTNNAGASLSAGRWSQVAIWVGTALDSTQVAALYNAGNMANPAGLSGVPAPTLHFDFSQSGDDMTGTTGHITAIHGSNGTPINTEAGDLVTDAP